MGERRDRKFKKPDMQIYRPGMGKFSSRSLKKDEDGKSPKTSPEESRESSPNKKPSRSESRQETRVQMIRRANQRKNTTKIIITRMTSPIVARSIMVKRRGLDLRSLSMMIAGRLRETERVVPRVTELIGKPSLKERKEKEERLMKKMLLRIQLTQELKPTHPWIKIVVVRMRK